MGNWGDFVEARGIEKGIIQALQNLMDSMKWTVQQAMDALQTPNGERSKYAELLKQGEV